MSEQVQFEVQDFQREVIERSYRIPVVVDFWAEWCGPCKVLGPVLERLASQQADRWELAKVNTDLSTEEAVRYGIQSIPNVKMFFEGKIIGEFVGAMPEYAVSQWLKKVLPPKNKNQVEAVKGLLVEGREEDAMAILESILHEDPDDPEAAILLARLLLYRDSPRSAMLIRNINEPEFSDQREIVSTFLHLFEIYDHPGILPDGPAKSTYLSAAGAVSRKEFAEALRGFIEVIRNDRYYDADGSRKACIAIFRYLGDDNPLTLGYRRDFNNALY